MEATMEGDLPPAWVCAGGSLGQVTAALVVPAHAPLELLQLHLLLHRLPYRTQGFTRTSQQRCSIVQRRQGKMTNTLSERQVH